MGMTYSTYDQVPWYRKNWFAFVCLILSPPAVLINLLTGNIYYEKKGQVIAYSKAAKIFIFIWFCYGMFTGIKQSLHGRIDSQATLGVWILLAAALYLTKIRRES